VPDYTKQLEEIARALNHPTTSAWLIATFAAFLEELSAVLSDKSSRSG
jgi:hypothetical protein